MKFLFQKGHKHSEETKAKIANAHRGRIYSEELREHNRRALLRPEVREKKAAARRGSKSHFWKGGLTEKNRIIRESYQYDIWRSRVFQRDNYTCVLCGATGCFLNADHIKPFSTHPELRFEVLNGRTLCVPCHKKTPTFGKRLKNNN